MNDPIKLGWDPGFESAPEGVLVHQAEEPVFVTRAHLGFTDWVKFPAFSWETTASFHKNRQAPSSEKSSPACSEIFMSRYILVDMKPGSAEELESEFPLRWGCWEERKCMTLAPWTSSVLPATVRHRRKLAVTFLQSWVSLCPTPHLLLFHLEQPEFWSFRLASELEAWTTRRWERARLPHGFDLSRTPGESQALVWPFHEHGPRWGFSNHPRGAVNWNYSPELKVYLHYLFFFKSLLFYGQPGFIEFYSCLARWPSSWPLGGDVLAESQGKAWRCWQPQGQLPFHLEIKVTYSWWGGFKAGPVSFIASTSPPGKPQPPHWCGSVIDPCDSVFLLKAYLSSFNRSAQ